MEIEPIDRQLTITQFPNIRRLTNLVLAGGLFATFVDVLRLGILASNSSIPK
jgi:hypothetical protein